MQEGTSMFEHDKRDCNLIVKTDEDKFASKHRSIDAMIEAENIAMNVSVKGYRDLNALFKELDS